jgi:tetratricopeptide (TPR) repeat protein
MAKNIKNKNSSVKVKPKNSPVSEKKRKIDWMVASIFALCFILYGNSIRNHYAMDDELVTNSKKFDIGVKAIPKIWVSLYSEGKLKYEYRPIVQTTYAIEHQFFGENPHVSHFINILLYAFLCFFLFKILKKLLKKYNPLFAYVIVLIFLAHPVHTEVVASLKNRDEILSMFGCLLTLHYLLKYIDTNKFIYVVISLIFYVLAYLSKASALVWLVIFPLTLYFYTEANIKKLFLIFGLILVAVLIARVGPKFYLPKPDRQIYFFENPLFFQRDLMTRLGTGMITLFFYVKILVYPHPLLFYYGYNEIPIVKIGDTMALISLAFHLGIFIYAIMKIREKHIVSFAILFYLVCISMFSNILKPAMGIVAERYVFCASLGFCIIAAFFIFKILKKDIHAQFIPSKDKIRILLLVIVLLIPYSAKTITRNKDWYSRLTLYKNDIKYLDKSAKACTLLAGQINTELNRYLFKGITPPNMETAIDSIIFFYKKSIEILPSFNSSYNNIGSVYFTALKDYNSAIPYFLKALEPEPGYVEANYNLAYSYELIGNDTEAVKYYKKTIFYDSTYVTAYCNLANIYYFNFGNFDTAMILNKKIMQIKPETDIPYVNIGKYYLDKKDTVTAMKYLETAIEKMPVNFKLCMSISNYYKNHDSAKSEKYYQMAVDAQKKIEEKRNKQQ